MSLKVFHKSVRAELVEALSFSCPSEPKDKDGPSTGSGRTGFGAALATIVLAFSSTPALAQSVAITGGTVVVGDGSAPIERGTVVIRDGRVVAAGPNVAIPADAERIDASGQWVTPGLVAGFSRIGLIEVDAVDDTNDSSAGRAPFSAGLDITNAINPASVTISVSRAGGVTRAVVVPATAGGMFAGQGAVIDLGADDDAIMRPRALQFVEYGERGAGAAGGSRAASDSWMRLWLDEGKRYNANPAGYGGRSKDEYLNRVDAKAIGDVVTGRTPLFVHVEQARDIRNVIALKRDYPALRLVLVGAAEGWMVAGDIAAAGIPVLATPLHDLPDSFEALASTQSNIGRMKKAGVKVAIGMIDDNDAHQIRVSPQYAGNLVALGQVPGASGLSWGEAFATISSVPAEIMGLGGEIGSLRPGRRGDVVIWSGDPLELTSRVQTVLIDGRIQPIDNRQTKLRDRYLTPQEGELPKAYQH